jgi:MFS family permease
MLHADIALDAVETPAARNKGATLALITLGLTILSASAMRTVFSPVQELAKSDLLLTDFQLSLVQGVAGAIPIALLSLPLGRVTDRGNRLQLLMILAAVWTLGTLGTAFATEFYGLFFSRMLAGIGAMCAVPVAISLTADLTAPEQRGRALLWLSLGNIAGAASAFAVGGGLLGAFQSGATLILGMAPWRSVHLAFALASLTLLTLLFLLREPPRREVGAKAHTALGTALAAIWERRALLLPLFLGQVTVVMADLAASIWAAPVLSRSYGLEPAQFSGWMGLVILGSGIVGSLVGAFAADFGQKLKMRNGILIGAVVASVLSIPGALFPIMPDTTGFAIALALLLGCGAITGLVTAATISVLIPNEIRGVCLGAFIVVSSVVGLGIAPTLVTLISEALGGEGAIRYGLAATGLATSIIAAIGFILAMLSSNTPRRA